MKKVTFSNWRMLITSLLFASFGLFMQTEATGQNPGCSPTVGFPDPPAGLACPGVMTPAVIWEETFDSGFGVFTEDPVPVGANDLTISTNGDTPSSGTGSECNPEGMSGPEYVFLEGSFTLAGETHCMSTTVDLTAEAAPLYLSFWYYMFGDNIGDLIINVNGTQEFIATGQMQTSQTDPWLQGEVDLSAYAGLMVTIQVCMTEGNGAISTFESDTSIDHMQIFNCALPPPIINCPMDVVTSNDPGLCTAQVSFSDAVAIDPDGGPVTVMQTMGPPSGSDFPVGVTVIEFTATDDEGDTSTCQFTITVEDNEIPIVTCPADIVTDNDPGICGAVVTYPNPTVMDNCFMGGGIVMDELSTLYAGGNGLGANATVYFDATIGGNTLTLNEIDINTDAALGVTVNADIYLIAGGTYSGNETNPGAWGAVASTASGPSADTNNPTTLVLTTPLTLNANTTYAVAVFMDQSVNYTNGNGTNEQYSNADITLDLGSATSGLFTGSVFSPRVWNGAVRYEYNASNAPYTVITGFPSGDVFPVGTTLTTLEYTDAGGNSVQCTFNVTVNDVEAPTVTCVGSAGTVNVSEDFDAGLPAGWSTVINTGTCDWENGTDLPTGDDFTTPAMFFDDDACGAGAPASNASLLSDVYDTSGGATVTLGYDVAFQEAGGGSTGTVEVWDGAAWQQVALYNVDLDPDIQTESIDITAYSNAALQVRWTFDDNGGSWGWHYGVDNFSLDYDIAAAPYDVVLDANGMASVPATDLVIGWDDNCGAGGVTISGGGGGMPSTLATTLAGGNGNFGNMFDINALNEVTIQSFDIHGDTGATFDVEVYAKSGTWVGSENNPGAWTLIGTAPGVVSNGDGVVTPLNLTLNYVIPAGETHAFYVTPTDFSTGGFNYTNGTATGNVFASDANIEFLEGAGKNYPFTGTTFQPRVFNGNILYETGSGGGGMVIDFTCDDLGITEVTIFATDAAGNESSCTAIVNVIDETPPVLVCQDVTIELGPDGTADINPEDLLANSPSTYDVVTISSDNQSGTEGFTDLTVPVTAAEVVSFDWDYTTPDGPAFDSFGYLLNGVYTELTDPAGALQQSGNSGPINLAPGDVFGFRSYSLDGLFGACTTTVSNFVPGFNGQFDPANWTVTLTNSDGDAFFVEIPGGPLSFDACGITVLAVDITEVTCDDIGTDYDETITITNPALMSSNVFSFTGTPTGATADAVLEVMTFGDIDGTGGNEEMWTITDEDSNVTGTIGATGSFSDQCNTTLTETFMIPAAMIDAWAADGQIDFTGTDVAGNINTVLCGGDFLSLRLMYSTGGNLTATVFASDASGNLAACQSMITVVDALAPEVTCPADQTVDPGPGNLFYTVPDYWAGGDATAADNCTDPVTVFSQDPPAGSQLPDGVYTVTLCATDEYGNEGCCTFELTVESILGAADNELGSAISMYPNPAAEQVTLANGSNILLDSAVIYDMNGKLVNTIDLRNMGSEMVIDVSQLASGVYMVQIAGEESTTVKRLIKE